MCRAGSPVAAVVALVAALLAAPAQAAVVYVSPSGDDAAGDGSAEHPFSTIGRAVGALAGQEGVVELAAGTYRSPQYTFPVALELGRSLTLRGPAAGQAVLEGSKETQILRISVGAAEIRPEIMVENLQVKGGLTGLSVIGALKAQFGVRILRSVFSGQRYQAVELVAGEQGLARAEIRGNRIEGGPAFGIDLAVRLRGALELEVVDNRIEVPPAAAGAGSEPPRYGMAIYSDVAARITGELSRNVLLNSGLLLLSQKAQGDPGQLDLLVSNCLIAGDPAPERNRLQNGLHLSFNQDDSTRLRLVNSTVAHPAGWAFLEDRASVPIEHPENLSIVIKNCIFWGTGKGDFSAESAGGDLPAYYREVRANLLSSSGRSGRDGNLFADPRFGPGYELGDGSPAIDAGEESEVATDLSGRCRPADGDGDGLYFPDRGALEKAGPCAAEARDFMRGDCQGDGKIDITDPVASFVHLFLGDFTPSCKDACDANDDAKIDLSDGVYLLGFLFQGSPPPRDPFPTAGKDPTADPLGPCQ